MKLIYKLSFLVLLTGFSLQTSNAQVTMERRIEGDGAFHLKEVQTILTSKDDTIKVMMVLPERLRPQGYGDIVLKENDEILMVNAKRVKTVQKFEELYNALEIGGILKMGIRRKGELMIESFKKIDPEDMPAGANIMIRTDASGGEEDHHGGGVMRTFTMDGGDSEDMRPWFGTGLVLGEEEGTLKVMRIMEGMTGALGKADIKEGDEIKSLNGQKIETLDKFFEMYEKLDTGSKVEFGYTRAGKKMQAAFEKPNVQGRMRMRMN